MKSIANEMKKVKKGCWWVLKRKMKENTMKEERFAEIKNRMEEIIFGRKGVDCKKSIRSNAFAYQLINWNLILPPNAFKLQNLLIFCRSVYDPTHCWPTPPSRWNQKTHQIKSPKWSLRKFHWKQNHLQYFYYLFIVSGQRKKKEVIEIDDSEEPQQPQKKNKEESRVKAVLSEKNSNLKKIKKISNKCQLCKETGKKKSMKLCVDCRAFFHIKCLEQEGEATNRYRCRKCRYKK